MTGALRGAIGTASLPLYHYRTRGAAALPCANGVCCPFVAMSSVWEKVCDLYCPLPASLTIFRTSRLRWNDAKETTTDLQASRVPIFTAVRHSPRAHCSKRSSYVSMNLHCRLDPRRLVTGTLVILLPSHSHVPTSFPAGIFR